jgi:enterochelin esterase-like enzyme
VSHFRQQRVYVRYPGGHVGFDKENLGLSFARAKQGIREAITVANRFTTLFAFASDHWPGGEYGTDPYELWRYPSKMGITYFRSPSLGRNMRFGIYLPPGYFRSRTTYYPILYLLEGYNMSIAGLANSYVKSALDLMILSGEIQKMIIVIPDGMNYKNHRGHFFVNQIDLERGDRFMDYFFDLVTYIDDHLQTK